MRIAYAKMWLMKLLSTTSVSKGIVTKSSLVAMSVLVGISTPLALISRAYADQYDNQIRALQEQKAAYDAQANALNAKAATLQDALNQIVQQKAAIMAQIALSQQQYDQLQAQIDKTKKDIADNKDALGQIIADMYVDDTITPLEMLASSTNIGDYVDKQTYREAIQSTLTSTIKDIDTLQKKLEKSQADVAKILEEQQGQKAQLAAKEAEQASLVEQTKGEEAAYQKLSSDVAAQAASAAAQQRAYYAALRAQNGGSVNSGVIGSFVYSNWSGNQGCGGDGYPYCGSQDSYSDPWDLYNRECVSYAAWRIAGHYGRQVQPFSGSGNAYQWPGSAAGATRVYDPQPGDAVVLPIVYGLAPVGHLMVVESPPSNGWVHVSQYNFYGTGEYSEMDIKTSGVIFLRFPG